VLAAAASHAQPAAEKLRAYQQHLSRIAADTHVDLSKVAEEHVQETSRTAKALADEVARVTTEETEKTLRTTRMRWSASPIHSRSLPAVHSNRAAMKDAVARPCKAVRMAPKVAKAATCKVGSRQLQPTLPRPPASPASRLVPVKKLNPQHQ
jgi:hypothetical protein